MSHCARCGSAFSCGVADNPAAQNASDASCWCMALPALPAKVSHDGQNSSATGEAACLCRDCLLAALAQANGGNEAH